ncbi:MAG: 2-oxoglutarate dehydrogenase complex dihydrolipoyllysine-residue succinyltransferase [Cellvibrionales bacterium]|jgi:2-oxoglutarate dehydrogenase E2 component (dihydrolipoamide succinyltransferase)|nr:2-oxoglutarate dehydrogenase complex dihydrolipoyllysine-residue succinyltransferase [Cellvibrionales bacterium]MCH9798267.1 2-oxoglutarate dehydrogenase complex dihydrolipoyllysine-residue succinyltransferase [Gammaproteobacteria bacterium]MDA7737315.1 2-oxoglutarate dehydrogenase complex dihydrolipoyllysine-residue succinyltransferase [Porticoccus sp.]MBT7437418.1 2-oxoglutarate dehydrogenase complex dihydrolipoyllysine-residue succinyltransferase [Cellvibrionales bacterium]MCH9843827.1 2-
MSIEIKAPTFPESVQEGSIATWHKKPGETVARDDLLVDIETDKVVLEVVAPADGTLEKTHKEEGETVLSNEVIASIIEGKVIDTAPEIQEKIENKPIAQEEEKIASPSARKLASEKGVDLKNISGSGKDGRITKEDVSDDGVNVVNKNKSPALAETQIDSMPTGERIEKRVPMTRMRSRIADRLLEVTQTTAMLTTFNEVDMHRVMNLRTEFKEDFSNIHPGARLGFMGFFVRAATEALKRFPSVNASIDGTDVVYHAYQDIGVAVSTDKGLVVPVLRNTDNMSIADVERTIAEFGAKARDGKLTIEEMTGGTFTITNGGVFGSLLSTPILNPPQAAILGMHSIKERPIAENGSVLIRPMMNLALSYDHRLIDGREAVSFLVSIKEMIENPAKILLEI